MDEWNRDKKNEHPTGSKKQNKRRKMGGLLKTL
jgi:hypothetical protein